jgi:hypothetical protein
MITLSRVKAATEEFIKVLRFGKKDVQTCEPILPAGIDSKPLNEDLAVHGETQDRSDPICLGYVWKSSKTNPGEIRIFARGTDGSEKLYLYIKNDGTAEFGGNVDRLVRYQKLDDGLQALKTKINVELGKIQAAITGLGGAYAKVDVSVDISASKINEIKTT